jgi:hypothetical protein
MAWSASKVFTAYIHDVLTNVTAMDLDTDASIKVPLFNNSITPDQTVTAALSAYNAGQWASGANEMTDTPSWPAGGIALTGVTVSAVSATTFKFDANDTPSADATTDLTGVFGCEVYDDTIAAPVADQGISYHYFGGSNSVVSGTFTVIWNAAGILTVAL